MALTLHRSHKLEFLADALACELKAHPAPPLEPERIITASLGLRRWLSHELAARLGAAMNIHFSFPSEFVMGALARMVPGRPPSAVYQQDILPWRIHARFQELLPEPEFETLRYFSNGDHLREWQLAGQIAAVFDRYLAYRPEMLLQWEAKREEVPEKWQARLWRAVSHGERHAPALLRDYRKTGTKRASIEELPLFASAGLDPAPPSRTYLFAPTTLSAFHLQVINAFSETEDLHLFLLTPTSEYWGDARGEKEQRRIRRSATRRGLGSKAEFNEVHPLLESLGKIGREFQEAVIDLSPTHELDHFGDTVQPDSLLRAVQHSIFALEPLQLPSPPKTDRSFQVHDCHSPMREVEVLHDQLLALFDADHSLQPRDVLVAVTDMPAYAGCIEAVFDAVEDESHRFPFSIADRAAHAENPVADATLRLMDVLAGRFSASSVAGLLDCLAIRTRFGIEETDLPLIREWISRSGIRWGIDAAHRERLGLPGIHEHTWRFGMERLVLGFALPPEGYEMFRGILPDGDIEGDLATLMGRFATFCNLLFSEGERLPALEADAATWTARLLELLERFCSGEDNLAEKYNSVAKEIASIGKNAAAAGHHRLLGFAAIHEHLRTVFSDSESGAGFLRGGVTFCSLKPMRAIPHRVIAVLGLNDDAFPRSARPPSYDLAAAKPAAGDRTLRDDDRYLFLEMLLSARDALILSYCGQSAKDNSQRPPSVLVTELLDYIGRACSGKEEARQLRRQLVSTHPLQAFSRRYFRTDSSLFTYSAEQARAAATVHSPRTGMQPFAAPIKSEQCSRDVHLSELTEALCFPSRFFLREQLGVSLPAEEVEVEDSEPVTLDSLQRYSLGTNLTEALLHGTTPPISSAAIRAQGALPHGYAGESAFAETESRAMQLAEMARLLGGGEPLPDAELRLELPDQWTLTGILRGITRKVLLRHRAAFIQPKDQFRAWLAHLALCAARPDGHPDTTIVLGAGGAVAFKPIEQAGAREHLLDALKVFESLHTEPQPFFIKSSFEYAATTDHGRGPREYRAQNAAARAWEGEYNRPGECTDAWNALLWRDHPHPLGERFRELAKTLLGPMVAATTPMEVQGGMDR